MILIAVISVLAFVLGLLVVPRFGVLGFLGAVIVVFAAQFGWNAANGYEGLPWADSLVFFNNSLGSYFGYNAQITYRAFAVPMGVLGFASVIGYGRGK